MSILKKIRETPEEKLKDDDHLTDSEKIDITPEEFTEGLNEIIEENKDKPAVTKKSNKLADATLKALNSLKSFFLFH